MHAAGVKSVLQQAVAPNKNRRTGGKKICTGAVYWRVQLTREFQTRAFEFLPFIPLGGYRPTSAWRDNLRGILKGPSIVFWDVTKT